MVKMLFKMLFWFLKELLDYFDEWKITVKARPGFEDDKKQHMILSTATENGIRITGMHTFTL